MADLDEAAISDTGTALNDAAAATSDKKPDNNPDGVVQAMDLVDQVDDVQLETIIRYIAAPN
jgi:hypothetical protein